MGDGGSGIVTTSESAAPAPRWHPDFVAHVERKYRYLLLDSRLSATERAIAETLLLERESAADPDLDAKMTLASIDSQLYALLHPSDYANYSRLRDSDEEQTELDDFVQGVSNYAPLDGAQERALLDARLRRRDEYQQALADSGASDPVAYREQFLADVAPLLSTEQRDLLRSFTTTQFVARDQQP
jgi:hypothetical protein